VAVVAAAADMAAVVGAATAAAIGDRAKHPIQYFCSKSARFPQPGAFY
jgi:hypothetical protein